MPDFSRLYKAPAGVAKRPSALPVSSSDPYPGIVKSFELVEAPQGRNYTTIVRFHLGLTGWPDGVEEADRQEEGPDGSPREIDLSKRQQRRDFYDHMLYQLDDFIRSCGVDPAGRTYEEVLPELIGAEVGVEIGQYLDRNNEIRNQVNNILGTAGA